MIMYNTGMYMYNFVFILHILFVIILHVPYILLVSVQLYYYDLINLVLRK